ELQAVRRHQRTLCEDLDELLGRLADAVRREHATATARLLDGAAAVATELARSLTRPEGGRSVAGACLLVEAPDEAQVQRAHRLLVELDAELDRTARGGGGAGAPVLAGCLRRVVDSLRGRDQQR
ncbi:MAG TPA: hypothetical protein VGE42_02420, partial [Candidatus Dormibacteraeota bacterium]